MPYTVATNNMVRFRLRLIRPFVCTHGIYHCRHSNRPLDWFECHIGITYKQLAAGKAITPECNNLLIVRKDFGLDRTLIVDYGRMAKNFFAGV